MKTWRSSSTSVIALLCSALCVFGQDRVWTDVQNRQLQAKLLSFENGVLSVERASDGQGFEIPFENLSQEDRKHLRQTPQFQEEAARVQLPADLASAAKKAWSEKCLYFIWSDKTSVDLSAKNEALAFNRLLLGGPSSPVLRLPIKYLAQGDQTARFDITTVVTFDRALAEAKPLSILWKTKGAGGPLGNCEAHWMIDERVYGKHEAKGEVTARIGLFAPSPDKESRLISNILQIQVIFSK